MEIREMYEKATTAVEELLRDRKFKKANDQRNAEINLTAQMLKCSGSLNIAKNEFDKAIRTQTANIKKGQAQHIDTMVQEQVLWDAALGYMLVRDAIYAVNTVHTYDSVAHANEMLQEAMNQIVGKKQKKLNIPFVSTKGRSEYAAISSEEALKQKEELLDAFFETLKQTGDIESCIMNAKNPAEVEGTRRARTSSGSGSGKRDATNDFLNDDTEPKGTATNIDVEAFRGVNGGL